MQSCRHQAVRGFPVPKVDWEVKSVWISITAKVSFTVRSMTQFSHGSSLWWTRTRRRCRSVQYHTNIKMRTIPLSNSWFFVLPVNSMFDKPNRSMPFASRSHGLFTNAWKFKSHLVERRTSLGKNTRPLRALRPWPFHSQEWSSSNFSCSLASNFTSHSMKNVAFRSLLRWKMIALPNSHCSTYTFLYKGLGECIFKDGSNSEVPYRTD